MYTLMDLCKNEKLLVLRQLLRIEEIFLQCPLHLLSEDEHRRSASVYIDHERYLKMAMRLDPNDPVMLIRKKKKNIRTQLRNVLANDRMNLRFLHKLRNTFNE